MSDRIVSVLKRRRLSPSLQREGIHSTSLDSESDTDGEPSVGHLSSSSTSLAHKDPGDAALLHLLDGYYIKRHSIEPWNTSGGSCDVFTGEHPTIGKVAMKRPRRSGFEYSASQLRNFRTEGQIWKELHHPNILQFVGMIDTSHHLWLVSIFAEHGTLPEYMRKHPEADRHSLVLQFTSGLAYLHSRGVVHGDLKALNLLISHKREVLIGDFGLSDLIDKRMRGSSLTNGVGSVRWMAPELLFEADPTKTFLSDVYAYAITISEILSGKLPFEEFTNHYALLIELRERNLRPPTIPTESPQGESYATLWTVAVQCWDPEPSKRPSMEIVCSRFSLYYTSAVGGAIPSGFIRAKDINDASGLSGLVAVPAEASPYFQAINSKSQQTGRTPFSSTASDARLLQLLGNAEYGDTGHMKDDGLCLEGTRIEALQRLEAWADDYIAPRVVLLKGQAGRGKSTIARSVSSRFQKRWGDNASSGIFHFRRSNEALNNRPIRALARQLACNGDPRVRAAVLKSVQDHEDIAELRLEEQFEILLLQPLRALEHNSPRILLVIDALDECSDPPLMLALLHLVGKYATSLPSTVKLLLTTRPEDHIVRLFNRSVHGVQEDLDCVDVGLIDRDVRAYFTARLSEIQRDFGLERTWASPEAVSELVSLSQGLFQWAYAAMEYVRESPRPRLQKLVRSPTVVLGLPALYQQILSAAFALRKDVKGDDDFLALIQHVIGSLVVADGPVSPTILEYLWDRNLDRPPVLDPAMEIHESILGRLSSILILPSTPDGPIHFMHTSVRDFFTDPNQCRDTRFLINARAHHARLADICFRRMHRDLRHDICGINDPSRMNSEVLDLVEHHIPSGLRYCCRSWSAHLLAAGDDENFGSTSLHKELDEFCAKRLLYWLGVLSLTGALLEAFGMIRRAREWSEVRKASHSQANAQSFALLNDTEDFCRRFFRIMSTNAQHITLSYLLHFPTETILRNVYSTSIGHQVPRIIRGPALHRSDWCSVFRSETEVKCVALSPDGQTLASGLNDGTIHLRDVNSGEKRGHPLFGHTDSVKTIAFSPDGWTLASGSGDMTIRFWSVDSGVQKGHTLVGHTGSVRSVAFSPDGKMLASGSSDTTIRIWTVDTGKEKGDPLVGHGSKVNSVTFTPDGKTLASGSSDMTILFWSVDTGEQKGEPLVGHDKEVKSVTFSPDGKALASGSSDETIRIWSVYTEWKKGELLVGHTDKVNSVAYSPDGKTLASGSSDMTIRIWNVDTREQKGDPLVGHTDWVDSIAFSPDGRTIASGSRDMVTRVWHIDPQHRKDDRKSEPLIGHTDTVNSVAYSPDGKTLASGASDMTIRLWDVSTGEQKGQPLVGHYRAVTSITFSHDGKILASGSDDKMIRLWDVDFGEQRGDPLGGHDDTIKSVAFSPDGKTLASGSSDMTIRLWTVNSGKQIGMPLAGHYAAVNSVVFSPNGRTLASGSNDKSVHLWAVDAGEQDGGPLVGHADMVNSVAYSDGNILVSKSLDRTICWRMGHGGPTIIPLHADSEDVAFESGLHVPSTLLDSMPTEIRDEGWVFVRSKRCFWLPEEFYMGRDGHQVKTSLFGGLLILYHQNIHILDISTLL